LSADERELQELRQALQALTRRVSVVESAVAVTVPRAGVAREREEPPAASRPAAAADRADAVPRRTAATVPPPTGRVAEDTASNVPTADLRAGLAVLDAAEDVKDFPRFFVRLAQQTGLGMLLLKRWSSGLEILLSEGIERSRAGGDAGSLPEGRIPTRDDDLFAALAGDHCVYAGPVPVKHFPLDLSLLLGRGQDRHIVVLPLPLRGRWNTFILLDAPHADPAAVGAAELLARYALARLLLLEHGEKTKPLKSAAILTQELARKGGAGSRGEVPARPVLRAGTPPGRPVAPQSPATPPATQPAIRVRPPAPVPGDGPVRSPADLATILRDVGDGASGPGKSRHAAEPAAAVPTVDPEDLIRRVGELPALPRVANHILALIADPNTTAGKLEKAIVLDQALTAKILKIANSSFYGGLRDVNTVSEAIVRLGFVTIRNWTLVTAAKSVFLDDASGPALQQIWQQSVLSAMASQLVAEHVRHSSPESVFVGGLMQNIGQLALAKASPELFRQVLDTSADAQVPYHVVERELLGFDHGALGALLIREWNLSDELEEAVRTHHRLAEAGMARSLAAMIALGEEIAACSGSVPDEGLTIWEMSEAARLLDVPETTYVDLLEKARRLRIDPQLFG
jgi:HD-like signal output (HDOD) protein